MSGREFPVGERKRWRQGILGIYEKMREKGSRGPYELHCGDLTLTVLPNVYAPRFFTDSLWFADRLPRIIGKGSLLEVGTGTGIIAIACALRGARVTATDVNPDAVRNASINAARYHLDISIRLGNLYTATSQREKFDFIFWVHPFNNWETPVEDMLLRSGMDYRYGALKTYIADARQHLAVHGRLLLGTADSADIQTIKKAAHDHGYKITVLDKAELPFQEGEVERVTYYICELFSVI